jgi:branched-chain amino acid transport system ATP-binding protein
MLAIDNLEVFYGRAQILFGLGLDVREGEAVALVGRNGAGKSTTLKSIIGLLRPTAGAIRFAGRDIAGLQPFEIARAGIGYVPEERRIFAGLSVNENLEVGRRAPARPGAAVWSRERIYALFPALAALAGRRAGTLSAASSRC